MPTYSDPKMTKEGELRLLMGRAPNHSHARSQNNWILMEVHGNNPLWINPKDAKKLGLKDTDKVTVTNVTTNFTSKAHEIKITNRIKENAVFIHHGFGHLSKAWSIGYDVGISDTDFCSRDIDPLSGAVGFNNGFVTIKKA
jgi:thiosulfate reductase/polysulfide reductase chain A